MYMKKYWFKLSILLVLGVACVAPIHAQARNEKVFEMVSANQRSHLASRLGLYVEYMLADQNQKLERLYDAPTLCTLCKSRPNCKEDYCKGNQSCLRECRAIDFGIPPGTGWSEELLELKVRQVSRIKGEPEKYKIKLNMKSRITINGKSEIVNERVSLKATLQADVRTHLIKSYPT